MSEFENATKFFHACESLQGWDGCKDKVDENSADHSLITPNDVFDWGVGDWVNKYRNCLRDQHRTCF